MSLVTDKTPREFAKSYLRPYVLRGDTIKELLAGRGGCSWTGFSVEINPGYAVLTHRSKNHQEWKSIKIPKGKVLVERFQNEEMVTLFDLKELCDEILQEEKQLNLFESGKK